MKLKLIAIGASIFSIVSAVMEPITYDVDFGNPSFSMNSVACSDGPDGLETKYGYKTLGDIPNFPYVGSSSTLYRGSPQCGQCFSVTFEGRTIYIRGIDKCVQGLDISFHAMDDLTGGRAYSLGSVHADVKPVAVHYCGSSGKSEVAFDA